MVVFILFSPPIRVLPWLVGWLGLGKGIGGVGPAVETFGGIHVARDVSACYWGDQASTVHALL